MFTPHLDAVQSVEEQHRPPGSHAASNSFPLLFLEGINNPPKNHHDWLENKSWMKMYLQNRHDDFHCHVNFLEISLGGLCIWCIFIYCICLNLPSALMFLPEKITQNIKNHPKSSLSKHNFCQYRKIRGYLYLFYYTLKIQSPSYNGSLISGVEGVRYRGGGVGWHLPCINCRVATSQM